MGLPTSPRAVWLALGVLGMVLALLAGLELEWSDELAKAAIEQNQASLAAAGHRVARAFDRELSRAMLVFRPGYGQTPPALEERYVDACRRWRAAAPFPGMVRRVTLAEGGSLVGRRLEVETCTLGDQTLSADLAALRDRAVSLASRPQPAGEGGRRDLLHPELPGLVFLLADFGPGGPGEDPRPRNVHGAVVVELDRDVLRGAVVRGLVTHELGDRASVAHPRFGITAPGGNVEWLEPGGPEAGAAEVEVELFRLLSLEEFEQLRAETRVDPAERDRAAASATANLGAGLPTPSSSRGSPAEPTGWTLFVRDAAGPLVAQAARARGRNLGLGLSVLAVLAAAAVALVLTTRAAAQLAEQRLRFVAGISHELRTPVAAIQALADNLAAGVVSDRDRARRYGEQIGAEVSRLGALVERALAFAGLASGRGGRERRPVSLTEVIDAAVAATAGERQRVGATLTTTVSARPTVLGDAAELQRAVTDLVINAIKFGGAGTSVGLTVEVERRGERPWARVTVCDDGVGIPRDEQERIFAPFTRGRRAEEAQVPGSGLGLFLVREAITTAGGTVELVSEPGRGATFTLRLPVHELA